MYARFLQPLLLLALVLISFCKANGPIVKLPTGLIRGKIVHSLTNKPFYQFEKIPYAEPPIGKLRFQPPVPKRKWSRILNTTFLDATCWQTTYDNYPEMLELVTEDCLFINVYTPKLPSSIRKVSYPVIFYIHGGGFMFDAAIHHFTGPELLIDDDVVIVTFNYRLGIFGFISTEDKIIPGNNGLKDQQLALQWTNKNIARFGGDPNRVVLFGSSAGAASTSFQLLNKNNNGLFRGALMSSGTSIFSGSLQNNPRETAFEIASTIQPDIDFKNDSSILLQFLRTVDPRTLANVTSSYTIGPVIEPKDADKPFITESMYGLLKKGDFIHVPQFLGFNSGEFHVAALDADLEEYDSNPSLLVNNDMLIKDEVLKRQIGENIRQYYTGNRTFSQIESGRGALARYISDDYFIRSTIKHAELSSKYVDVYLYEFSYDGQLGNYTFPIISGADGETVLHAEDVHYIWCDRTCPYRDTYPQLDLLTSKRLRKLFTNFIKYLNPTPIPDPLLQNIRVPTYETTLQRFININATLQIQSNPGNGCLEFWNSQYGSLGRDDFNTF